MSFQELCLLQETGLNLDKLLNIAIILEASERQVKHYKNATKTVVDDDFSDSEELVNKVASFSTKFSRRAPKELKKTRISFPHQKEPDNVCFRCGSKTHYANKCEVTRGKSCNKCVKQGHFSHMSGVDKYLYVRTYVHKTAKFFISVHPF